MEGRGRCATGPYTERGGKGTAGPHQDEPGSERNEGASPRRGLAREKKGGPFQGRAKIWGTRTQQGRTLDESESTRPERAQK